jgi:hypothetical protein
MTLHAVPKTIFDRSLKLARTPFDAALAVVGASDSAAKHAVDRMEAGARSAGGILFADEELKEQGERGRLATRQRERAVGLHEEAELREEEAARKGAMAAEEAARKRAEAEAEAKEKLRKAEKRRRERESRAAKSASAQKEKAGKAAAKTKRANAKRDQAASSQSSMLKKRASR